MIVKIYLFIFSFLFLIRFQQHITKKMGQGHVYHASSFNNAQHLGQLYVMFSFLMRRQFVMCVWTADGSGQCPGSLIRCLDGGQHLLLQILHVSFHTKGPSQTLSLPCELMCSIPSRVLFLESVHW